MTSKLNNLLRSNGVELMPFLKFLSQPAALQQLTSLYVSRSKTVWRDADILPWLSKNVNAVLDRVDAKDPMVNDFSNKRSQR